jgi:hypothetical protein
MGAPISSLMTLARSGMRFLYSAMIRASRALRSSSVVWL